MMVMVETKMGTASKPAVNLQGNVPSGQNLSAISISEKGIVKKHRNKSEIVRFKISKFRGVFIWGLRLIARQTMTLPKTPIAISKMYANVINSNW